MRCWTEPFGTLNGRAATLFCMENARGMRLSVTDYGARAVHIELPGAGGRTDVLLGYDDVAGYAAGDEYFGAICGRFANRLADAAFSLEGVHYALEANDGVNTLHGGTSGYQARWWSGRFEDGNTVLMSLRSPDGDGGYPGTLDITVAYMLTEDNAVRIYYDALPTAETVVNLTNHSYFNLAGRGGIESHELTLQADFFTPVADGLLPTGEIRPVAGTPFDFRAAQRIGAHLSDDDEQLRIAGGYDHNFVLRKSWRGAFELAAVLTDPASGRRMECRTTQPGIQFYTGNALRVAHGRGGAPYAPRAGLCLETQCFPNAMACAHFPSPVLHAGERYLHVTEYRFFTPEDPA